MAFALEKVLMLPAELGPRESSGHLHTCQWWKVWRVAGEMSGIFPDKTLGEEPVSSLSSAFGSLRGSASFPWTQGRVGLGGTGRLTRRPGFRQHNCRHGCCSGVQGKGLPMGMLIFTLQAQGPCCCQTDSPAGWSKGHSSFPQETTEELSPVSSSPYSTLHHIQGVSLYTEDPHDMVTHRPRKTPALRYAVGSTSSQPWEELLQKSPQHLSMLFTHRLREDLGLPSADSSPVVQLPPQAHILLFALLGSLRRDGAAGLLSETLPSSSISLPALCLSGLGLL